MLMDSHVGIQIIKRLMRASVSKEKGFLLMCSLNCGARTFLKQGLIISLLWFALAFIPIQAQEATDEGANGEVTVELLAEALADDAVRDQLVEHLRAISQGETVEVVDEEGAETPLVHSEPSTASRFVQRLQVFAQGLREDIHHSWRIVLALFKGDSSQVERIKSWQQAVISLVFTIVVT